MHIEQLPQTHTGKYWRRNCVKLALMPSTNEPSCWLPQRILIWPHPYGQLYSTTTLPINNRNCGNNPLFLHSSWNWVNVQTFSPVWLAHHNEMSTFTAALLNTGTQTKLTIVHKVFVECRLQCYTVLGWCMYLKVDMTSCTTSNPMPTGIKYKTIVDFWDSLHTRTAILWRSINCDIVKCRSCWLNRPQ